LIIGVGGFLGAGEKDVAVKFDAIHAEMKDGAWYLTLDTTKDALKSAPGLTFNKEATAWVPAKLRPRLFPGGDLRIPHRRPECHFLDRDHGRRKGCQFGH